MSKKVNTTSIGLFIVAGLALGIAGLLLFSSSKIFSESREVIAYFDDSLNGLNEGAPVKYRGVTIGSVKRVMVRFNQTPDDYAMPVILTLEERLLRERLGETMDEAFTDRILAERIRHGLRASLQTESLVTGVLYVDIRPSTNAPPPFFHQLKRMYPELPTEPTRIQQLFNNLASLDLKSVELNLNNLIVRLDSTVGALHMAEINRGLTNLLASVDRLVSSADLTNSLAGLRPTLDVYRELAERLGSKIDPVAEGATNSLAQVDHAMVQLRGAAENLRILTSPDAPLPQNLDQTLHQLSGAVQSLSVLLDFLKQHPNSLITGRKSSTNQR